MVAPDVALDPFDGHEENVQLADRRLDEALRELESLRDRLAVLSAPSNGLVSGEVFPLEVRALFADQLNTYIQKAKTLKKTMPALRERTEKLQKRVEKVRQRKEEKEQKEKQKWAAVQKK